MSQINVLSTEGQVFQGMGMSEVPSRGKPKLCGVSISVSEAELGKAVSGIRPAAHKGAKSNGFGGNTRKDIKGMSRDNVRELGDYGNAVLGIGGFV
jgi:hypothetical protein